MQNKEEKMKFSWFDLARSIFFLLGKNKKKYLFWTIVLLVLFLYQLVPPLILGEIVDFFTLFEEGGSLNIFYNLTIFLGVSYIVVAFMRLTAKRILKDITTEVVCDIRVKGFDNLLAQSMLEHKDENTGAKSQKIENGTRAFQSLNSMFENQIYVGIITIVGMILVFAVLSLVM